MSAVDVSPSEGSGPSKSARKQGVSCDACKFRKVKCDRRAKIESRQEEEGEESVACSVCSSHGLRCTYTQMAPKRRRGKRIVAIQRGQLENLDDSKVPVGSSLSDKPGPNDGQYSNDYHRTQGGSSTVGSTSQSLLGVQGMTRALLDACVKSYFKYTAPCTPILHAEVFAARYALFFVQLEKNGSVEPFWKGERSDAHTVDRPLSELLLLAVGCIGASLLEPPIAVFGSTAKFRLQDRLALKFQETLNKDDLLLRLQHEGADVIEACYVMSDPLLTVLGDEWPSRSTIDWETVSQLDRSQRDPLRLRPASHEGIVRLIFKMGINRRPNLRKDCPPGDNRTWESMGAFVTERETFRRLRIFWSAFMQDSFRSMGERRNVLIGAEDYDLDLPRFMARQDGFFTSLFFSRSKREMGQGGAGDASELSNIDPKDRPSSVYPQPARFSRFDAIQFEMMLRLAFIIRTISIKFVSPRSQGRGVLLSDVERAVSALSAWYQQLPSEVTWEVQSEPLTAALQEGKSGSSNATAMRNSVKALFLEVLFHGNVLGVWGSVDSFGTRTDDDINDTMAMFSSRMKLHEEAHLAAGNVDKASPCLSSFGFESRALTGDAVTSATSSSSEPYTTASTPFQSQKPEEEMDKMVKQKLDNLAARSFLRVSKVAKEAARVGLVRACRLVFVGVFSSYAVWGCGLARKLAASGDKAPGEGSSDLLVDVPPGYNQIEYMFKCVENLINSVGAVDSFEGAAERTDQLRGLLQSSRDSCQESAQSERSRTTGGANGTRPSQASAGDNSGGEAGSPAYAPFRYYFQTGGRRGLGDTRKGQGGTRGGGVNREGAGGADMDEVAMLAQAAMPVDSTLSLADDDFDASPFSHTTSEGTPDGDTQIPDQTLDFDLESIAGMDTQWLHQFLQGTGSAQALVQQQQQPSYGELPLHPLASNHSMPHFEADSSSIPLAPLGGDGRPMQPFSDYALSNEPMLSTGVDVQWDQFMANSDAQLWANAQWQGFNTDSMMA